MAGLELFLILGIPVIFLVAAYLIGSGIEKRHFQRLEAAEARLRDILVVNLRTLPPGLHGRETLLVAGQVALATDYFKQFVASWVRILGGRIKVYERLMERARREAIVRMLEEARAAGFSQVWNLRIESATLGNMRPGQFVGMTIIAYGTAVR